MADAKESMIDEHDQMAEPPLLDSFHLESSPAGFSVTFIPSAEVSSEQTEIVFVKADSAEGRLLRPLAARIDRILGSHAQRIVHAGGGNYTFHLSTGQILSLDDAPLSHATTLRLFDTLKHMAQIAECAFAVANWSKGRVA
jgi:hypothetical protein